MRRSTALMRVAVLIPCLNEALTVATVVKSLRVALPQAEIYVYDNGSDDGTGAIAASAGAIVRTHHTRGKGSVVRAMFEDVDADAFVLIDGDDTYEAARAPALVERLARGDVDMVIATRKTNLWGPRAWGNVLLTRTANAVLGVQLGDMLSGFRAMSRRFVKSYSGRSTGFDFETELAIHAAHSGFKVAEISTSYQDRPRGSHSKLRPVPDALRILFRLATSALERRGARTP